MSTMLDALHQRTPLPAWAPPPAPLPRGPYPTLKWPEGCTHLAGVKESLTTAGQPKPDCIAAVKALGADWIVAFEVDGPHEALPYQFGTLRALPARALLTKVKLGGKWFDATEGLTENFFDAIQQELDAMEWNA